MAICQYYQRGNCRFGDKCRFEHPGYETPNPLRNNDNRYAALEGRESPNPERNAPRSQVQGQNNGRGNVRSGPPLTKDIIILDLQNECPAWILSAYGPMPKGATQLFGGELREQSFEEARAHHYLGIASGNPQLAAQQFEELVAKAKAQNYSAIQDPEGAVQYVYNAENEHPNRIDICNSNSLPALGGASPFNQPSTNSLPTANAFSSATSGIQPTSTANPFGASSTQAVQPAIGTGFGQPSSLGQRVNPFGAANAGGQTGASGSNAFLVPGPSSSAGNPFGAPSQAPRSAVPASNPFGAPSQPAASNPFGGASQAPAPNPFSSQPTPAAAPNPFGAIVQPAKSNPFSAAPSSVSLSPFGAPIPPVISIPQGAPSAPVAMNPFGAPSPASANPFGTSSQPPATSASRFGQPPVPYQQNPFGAPKPQTSNGFTQGASAAPATTGAQVPSPYAPTAESQHPSIHNYSSRDGNGRLTMFKGKAVVYNNGVEGVRTRDGGWEKIWFPNGAPPYYKATEADDELYDEATKASYFRMRETGTFPNGEIPLVPPKREFCVWDF